MRRERHGGVRPLWADMQEPDRENMRQRADVLIRIVEGLGGSVAVRGEELIFKTPKTPEAGSTMAYAQRFVRGKPDATGR